MEKSEYKFWKVTYISCEGNERWNIVKTPRRNEEGQQITEEDVECGYPIGGYDDAASQIVSVEEEFGDFEIYDYLEII